MIDANIGGSMTCQTNAESEFIPSLGGGSMLELPVAFSSEINQLNKLMDGLSCKEGDVKELLQWLESSSKKCKRQVDIWLKKVQDLKNEASDMNKTYDHHGMTDLFGLDMESLTKKARKRKQHKPLVLSNELVG